MAGKSALPLLALAGGVLLLAGGKKKKRKSGSSYEDFDYENFVVPPTPPPANATQTSGPSGKTASAQVWKQRQTALAFVAGMKVCNCHPGNIDGLYGPATINAIIAFQVCTDIQVDGKWGPQTDAMMKKILSQIAEGQVKIKTTSSENKELEEDPYEKLSRYNLYGSILGYLPNNVYYVDITEMNLEHPGKRMFKFNLENGDRFAELRIHLFNKLTNWSTLVTMLREIAIDAASRGVTIAFSLVESSDFGKADMAVLFLREKDKDVERIIKYYKLSFDSGTISTKLPKAVEGWLFSVGGWLKGMNQTL